MVRGNGVVGIAVFLSNGASAALVTHFVLASLGWGSSSSLKIKIKQVYQLKMSPSLRTCST